MHEIRKAIATGTGEPSGDFAARLDGAARDQWPDEALGRHVGYLPQDTADEPRAIRGSLDSHCAG
ncbi:hypothetical protein [Microvirga sp. G4-2]|uniref:hypothetical protein n=1 Tax=Microvirga sp. G4-2 TaxID=3434467 RepID=UPI004043E862